MKARKSESLDTLFSESQAVVLRLHQALNELHGDLGLTPGMRDLLRHLAVQGPATVPEIARERGVSRQHVQTVVNRFHQDGLVKFLENPRHRRSRIVRINKRGRRLIAEMDRRQRQIWQALDLDVRRTDLEEAARTLAGVRALFSGKRWRRAVRSSRKPPAV